MKDKRQRSGRRWQARDAVSQQIAVEQALHGSQGLPVLLAYSADGEKHLVAQPDIECEPSSIAEVLSVWVI